MSDDGESYQMKIHSVEIGLNKEIHQAVEQAFVNCVASEARSIWSQGTTQRNTVMISCQRAEKQSIMAAHRAMGVRPAIANVDTRQQLSINLQ